MMSDDLVSLAFMDLNMLLKQRDTEIYAAIDVIKNITVLLKTEENRILMSSSNWDTLANLMMKVYSATNKPTLSSEELTFIAELFRCLRNACAGCFKNQEAVISTSDIFDTAGRFLINFITLKKETAEEALVPLRCCLQFFGNLVSQNDTSKVAVWDLFCKEQIFRRLLGNEDIKVQEYLLMVLYNCLTPDHVRFLTETDEGHEMLVALTTSLYENVTDWGILCIEAIVKDNIFVEKFYNKLPVRNRLLLLDVIVEELDNTSRNESCSIPMLTINCFSNIFTNCSMDIMKACSSEMVDLKPNEIVKLLSLLCTASVLDQYSPALKNNSKLIETSLDVLKSVHLVGKTGMNAFSALSCIQDVTNVGKEEVEMHPAFGFKKNLIRLVGNLCSQCKQNQDLVRSMDGIALILDCCNLDARNPYILQWCILAIRNLLENNPENQAIVAGITVTGDLVNSALLQELGLEVRNQDGRLTLSRYTGDSL